MGLKLEQIKEELTTKNCKKHDKTRVEYLRVIVKKLLNKRDLSDLNEKEFDYLSLLAEFIGIILGDGNIRQYSLIIDLNGVDEAEYVNYVCNLIFQVLGINPQRKNRKGIDGKSEGKGIRLIINGINIINLLIKIGLKIGHKIKNNVKVPDWILNNKLLVPFALRGLFDTDGNIDIHKEWRSLTFRFVSGSKTFVKNFRQMCETLGIKTSNIRKIKIRNKKYNKDYDAWVVSIGSKESVQRFISIVKPNKYIYRKKLIAMILLILEDPEKTLIIKKELKKYFPEEQKINQFTKDYLNFLREIFNQNNWIINDYIVENLINQALKLKTHNYNIHLAEEFKELFEKYGTVNEVIDYYKKTKGMKLDSHIIKKHIKKLLSDREYAKNFEQYSSNPLELTGITFYERWDKNNSRIIIEKKLKTVIQFNSKLRLIIALEVYRFLSKFNETILPKTGLIVEHLKQLIEKSSYLGRLSYLLKDNEQASIITNYLNKIINIVKEITYNPIKTAYKISQETGLKRDTIQEIKDKIVENKKK